MRLSREVLDAYNAAIKKQGDNAESAARKALEAWFEENPNASVADAREFSIALMNEISHWYGNAAGDVAYALRDMTAEAAEIELPAVDYEYSPDAECVRDAAQYQAGKLDKGDVDGFIDGIADASRYFSERGANDTTAALGNADSRKYGERVRFARIPTGATTCPYCCMLASRGFVYKSGLTSLNANHRHCDCRIIEGFDGMAVEGYDPDEYLDRWQHPEIYKGLDDVTVSSLSCLRVAEKRGQVVYDKPLLSFLETEDGRRDLFAHAALARAGKRFRALAEDAPKGYSNIDLLMDGQKWELKSPPGDNPRAVESNLRKAKKQFGKNYPEPIDEVRVLFNSGFYGQNDSWVSGEISLQCSAHGITDVLMVGKDGSVTAIKKVWTPSSERPDLQDVRSIAHAASSVEEFRSPKPKSEVRLLGGVPTKGGSERGSSDAKASRKTSDPRKSGGRPTEQGISRNKHRLKDGRTAYSQAEIDEVIERRLPGLRFPVAPEYVPNLKDYGQTRGVEIIPGHPECGYKIEAIKIGPQKNDDEDELVDTILHELLEARAMMRGDRRLAGGDEAMHPYIDTIIAKYVKMKGWKR